MNKIIYGKHSLFNPIKTEAFIGFARSQAMKYFTKARRYSRLQDLHNFLSGLGEAWRKEITLESLLDEILADYSDPTYCYEVENNGSRALYVCGKIHHGGICAEEFYKRISAEYSKYGHRTKLASEMEYVDWKSLSHAVRALIEVKMLYTEYGITFPFKQKDIDLLMKIKLGLMPYEEVENILVDGIDEVKKIQLTNVLDGLDGDGVFLGS